MQPISPKLPSLKRAVALGGLICSAMFCLIALGAGSVSRSYNYKGYDTNGTLVVTGVITVRLDDASDVDGTWRLKILDSKRAKELGPQDGEGKISGQFKGERVFLNLSPKSFWNNVYLDGHVTKADIFTIRGKWGYYGYSGKANGGDFEMVRTGDAAK